MKQWTVNVRVIIGNVLRPTFGQKVEFLIKVFTLPLQVIFKFIFFGKEMFSRKLEVSNDYSVAVMGLFKHKHMELPPISPLG